MLTDVSEALPDSIFDAIIATSQKTAIFMFVAVRS
jgi:uroporphyrinogen-III synthase